MTFRQSDSTSVLVVQACSCGRCVRHTHVTMNARRPFGSHATASPRATSYLHLSHALPYPTIPLSDAMVTGFSFRLFRIATSCASDSVAVRHCNLVDRAFVRTTAERSSTERVDFLPTAELQL